MKKIFVPDLKIFALCTLGFNLIAHAESYDAFLYGPPLPPGFVEPAHHESQPEIPKPIPTYSLPHLLPVPEFFPRARKTVLMVEEIPIPALVKHAKKYEPDVPKKNMVFELPKILLEKKLFFQDFKKNSFDRISSIDRPTMTLLSNLILILNDQKNAAVDGLWNLSQDSEVKKNYPNTSRKSLSFLGRILAEDKFPSMAGFISLLALKTASSGNTEEEMKYDTFSIETFSLASQETPAAKRIGKNNIFESYILNANLARKNDNDSETISFAHFALAERAFDQKKFDLARDHALKVSNRSYWSDRAKFLAALSLYAKAPESRPAIEKAGRELTELFRKIEDNNIFDSVAATLGRMHFLLGNYKAANQYLSQVAPESNQWLDAAIDNGWALLKENDIHHAVGNMFTLHTPYFEGAYMPDSFFLQALGYQNLCQFGDAFTAIKKYKSTYISALKAVSEFNRLSNKASHTYSYENLSHFLITKSISESESPIVMRELARQPEYFRRQAALNWIFREEKNIKTLFHTSGEKILTFIQGDLQKLKDDLRLEASSLISKRSSKIEEQLKFVNSNMALLEYEVYAGASRNLAQQGAQNFSVDENSALKNKPEDDSKEYWPYEEEVWEDELNHFRSKIIDGCATKS